ncbi:TIGR03862 family flavoprotein [Zavarzinia sp.]|uniref:TIGR03862 family flavoprotein n=1 Tax=Zavarzinia sp. TaxID=2027920 RepID=UPI00356AACD2
MSPANAIVIGGGPAGLTAAEVLLDSGASVTLFDAMPSLGRKFLMAGKSGLNITHAEDLDALLERFGPARARLEPAIRAFGPPAIRDFCAGLGIETFTGSSGRVFPAEFKAAPLLRTWLHRLRGKGLQVRVRHRWLGFAADGTLRFASPAGEVRANAAAVVLALGGASWPSLGSDGAWVPELAARHVALIPFRPANCGFAVAWSEIFRRRFAGQPVKPVALSFGGQRVRGEFVVTERGVEGGAVYALSAALRDALERDGQATAVLDLAPGKTEAELAEALAKPQSRHSLTDHIRRTTGLDGVRAGLLREGAAPADLAGPAAIARRIKALPLPLLAANPLAEAISSAGGVALDALDENWMLKALPGVFCAGEMIDWEAPTGGYLLTACLGLGRAAGAGAAQWLERRRT